MSLTLDNAADMFFDVMEFIATDEEAKDLFLTAMEASEIDEMLAEMKDPDTKRIRGSFRNADHSCF